MRFMIKMCRYIPRGLEGAEWARRGTVTRNRRKTEGLIMS